MVWWSGRRDQKKGVRTQSRRQAELPERKEQTYVFISGDATGGCRTTLLSCCSFSTSLWRDGWLIIHALGTGQAGPTPAVLYSLFFFFFFLPRFYFDDRPNEPPCCLSLSLSSDCEVCLRFPLCPFSLLDPSDSPKGEQFSRSSLEATILIVVRQ